MAEFTMEDVKAALTKIGDQVKESGEKALAEAKQSRDISASAKEHIDELLVKQGELQARLLEVEQKAARSSVPGGSEQAKSLGAMVAGSDELKAYVSAGNYRRDFNYPMASIVTITERPASGGQMVLPDTVPGIVAAPNRRMTVRDLLTPGTTNSNLIQYMRETGFQNMAAPVSEATAKPKSDITFDLVSRAVVKIATYVKASTEILADVPMLQSYIDGRLRYMLAYVEEQQLLKGSGVGNNLNGIYTQATAYVAPTTLPGSPTRIDQLRLMLLQAELAEYPSTGIVLHPIDWAEIELKKDTLGRYIIGNPQGTLSPTLWGRPVVATQAMTQDTALVGAFRLGAQVFDRQQSNIQISSENEDDFINNLVTILIEERLALAVYRPAAFVKSTNLVGS